MRQSVAISLQIVLVPRRNIGGRQILPQNIRQEALRLPFEETDIPSLDLLSKIRDAMGLDVEIEPFDDPPCDRSLDPARFVAATAQSIPTWDEMAAELAADPTPYDDWRLAHAAA